MFAHLRFAASLIRRDRSGFWATEVAKFGNGRSGAGFDCDGFSVNGFELQRNEGDEGLIEFNRDGLRPAGSSMAGAGIDCDGFFVNGLELLS